MAFLNIAKVTFAFQQGVYGWTENYFLPEPSSSLDAEFVKAEALAAKRVAMCGFQTGIAYIKISRENVKRDVRVFGYNYAGNVSKASDAPSTALLFRRYGDTPVANAPIFLRGIWDELIIQGGEWDQTNAAWMSRFNAYRGQLISDGWGFVAKDPTGSFFSSVTNVASNVNGTVTITTLDAVFTGLTTGTLIRLFVSGVQGAAIINGVNIYRVSSNSSATSVKRIPIFPYTTGGKVTFTNLKFYRDLEGDIVRVVERKAGRPLYVSRGRRAARRVS